MMELFVTKNNFQQLPIVAKISLWQLKMTVNTFLTNFQNIVLYWINPKQVSDRSFTVIRKLPDQSDMHIG